MKEEAYMANDASLYSVVVEEVKLPLKIELKYHMPTFTLMTNSGLYYQTKQ